MVSDVLLLDSSKRSKNDIVEEAADEGTTAAIDEKGYEAGEPDVVGKDIDVDRSGEIDDADEAE